MTSSVKSNLEETALVPNVMQPSPINNIKIVEIDQKRVIHTVIMNKKYLTQCTCVPKTRQYPMVTKMIISPSYI